MAVFENPPLKPPRPPFGDGGCVPVSGWVSCSDPQAGCAQCGFGERRVPAPYLEAGSRAVFTVPRSVPKTGSGGSVGSGEVLGRILQ